jgi:acetyltransferase-like isoleucine patch superfamily enzyme
MRLGPGGAPSYGLDVKIGDDCWIGGNVTVLGGVTIGDGCVIGACSLVTKVRLNHCPCSYLAQAFRDDIFLYPHFVITPSGPYSIVRGAGRRVTWNRISALIDEPINSRDFPCLVFSFILPFYPY